jgi:hypothetical protein
MRGVVTRFDFLCNLTKNRPQSITGHTAKFSGQAITRNDITN